MDKNKVIKLRAAIEKALENSAELRELGVSFKLGNCRFDDKQAKFVDLLFIDKNENGEMVKKEELDFKRYCDSFGLKEEHFGKIIEIRGRQFRISGLNPKAINYPIIAIDQNNGKTYKLSMWDVRSAIGIDENEEPDMILTDANGNKT